MKMASNTYGRWTGERWRGFVKMHWTPTGDESMVTDDDDHCPTVYVRVAGTSNADLMLLLLATSCPICLDA
jgi:hypothetical protein